MHEVMRYPKTLAKGRNREGGRGEEEEKGRRRGKSDLSQGVNLKLRSCTH
jgi:hypothetical protein